jgi:hypothetical protein
MANVVDRLGGASSSLAFKAPCRLGTTANITLSGYQTIDGTLPTSSEHVDLRRILVKDQDTASENGIYIMDTGTWVRTKDFDGANDIRQGTRMYVFGGSTQSGTYIVTSSVDPSTFDIDTTSITIAEVGTFDQETASLGISSGGKISFDSDDVTITHSSSALAFAGAGAGYTFDSSASFSGSVHLTATNAGLEIGSTTAANTPHIDFHSGASGVDYDSRLIASTGSSASGGGSLGVDAVDFSPTPTDGVTLGTSAAQWSDLFLASGGVVNWDGSNVTLTHSSSALAFASGSVTFSGSVTASSLITGSAGISVNSTFTSSGNIHAVSGTTITLGGVAGKAIMLFGSTTFGIYAGSSAPAIAAGQGSIYLRNDGGSSLTRAYIQSSGSSNTWVGVLTTA